MSLDLITQLVERSSATHSRLSDAIEKRFEALMMNRGSADRSWCVHFP